MDLRSGATRAQRATAAWLRSIPFFDADFYVAQVGDPEALVDPALHYLLRGEAAGAAASSHFNAANYVRLNPDLRAVSQNQLVHYELHGRGEGRKYAFESDTLALDDLCVDPGKPTLLLALDGAGSDDASFAGWTLARELQLTRNVVTLLRRGGALMPALEADVSAVVLMPPAIADDPAELDHLARRLKAFYQPIYTIAHGVATRLLVIAVKDAGVPVIGLVNEFADEAPPHALSSFYRKCDILAFASEGAHRSSLHSYDYGLIAQRTTLVLRQGPLEPKPSAAQPSVRDLIPAARVDEHPFTVLGMGPAQLFHGLDLFIAAAMAMKARAPELKFRFIWMGERPSTPDGYVNLLNEQFARSGLRDEVILAEAHDDPAQAYAGADAFFLSSSRDVSAFAGVAAALSGLPVLCFQGATGLAEVLERTPGANSLVAPYLNIDAIAERLVEMARNPGQRQASARATQKMARRTFSSIRYAATLDDLGHAAAARRDALAIQLGGLEPAHAFDPGLYFGSHQNPPESRQDAIRQYLEDTVNVDWSGPAVESHHPRRPLLGFNPLIYGRLAPDFDAKAGVDPLVDYVRKGCPRGPWVHDVILPGAEGPAADTRIGLRVALHGHFHYTDNFSEFLNALEADGHPIDLFLTTTTDASADVLRSATAEHYSRGKAQVEVGVNIGRDIGPFLSLLQHRLDDYDVVGHVHGKRSVHSHQNDPRFGERWRNFLWQHLLGPAAPVIDVVLARFAAEPDLGLVFPENEHLIGWEQNRSVADALAPRLGLQSLPEHVEFPAGTMFWARTSALRLLREARFTETDYQAEPLPPDGTLLHALERLLPLVVEAAGFRYATTHLRGFTR